MLSAFIEIVGSKTQMELLTSMEVLRIKQIPFPPAVHSKLSLHLHILLYVVIKFYHILGSHPINKSVKLLEVGYFILQVSPPNTQLAPEHSGLKSNSFI